MNAQTEQNKLKKILVLFGGCSPEYEVSLQSAAGVLDNLDKSRYKPVPVGITREGKWLRYEGDTAALAADRWQDAGLCAPALLSPDRDGPGLLVKRPSGWEAEPIDAAFPVLHGQNGEDGTVQGLIELAGIPLVGCGTLASALCMDKDRAHKLAALTGVRVPRSFVVGPGYDGYELLQKAEALGWPVFVKPVRAGSSFGVSRVAEAEELLRAVDKALAYDETVLVEEAIAGFEVGCAVLGKREIVTGLPDEIELSGGFFDFQEKYGLVTSRIHVPARVAPEKLAEIRARAADIYRALGCSGFARVDLFLTPEGELVFNEVNTIPGFTPHSRYPAMMRAAGMDFPAVLTAALEEAMGA